MFSRTGFCRKGLLLILAAILFLPVATGIAHAEDGKKSILVLNSYHQGLSWTDGESQGIAEIIGQPGSGYSLFFEYMDWKNNPTEGNLEHLYAYFKYKYAQKPMDLVITTDDAALEFALKNRAELFSDAPVVFCGVNAEGAAKLTKGYSRVTGVLEEVDPEQTIRLAMDLNPRISEILVMYDNTESGLSTGAMTLQRIREINPGIKIKTLNDKNMAQILEAVKQVPEDGIILITTYYVDAEGTVVGFEDSCRLVSENSSVPVYHLYDFGIGHGAMGGSMLSGKMQGENAAKIAMRILGGEDIGNIPQSNERTTRFIFDYSQLQRFNISLDKIPKGSQIINKPFSFLETYRHIVIGTLLIFTILLAFIWGLVFHVRKINKMRKELYDKHEELTQIYEELMVSEETLREQYEELSVMQKDLVSSEERYALLFERMLNGFFVFEPVVNHENRLTDIRFKNVNPGFEHQTGVKANDITGKTWMEVFKYPSQDLNILQGIWQTGEAEHFETYSPELGIYYLVNAFKISDNRIGVVFENITEYKQAIKEIRELNEGLEQRVNERTSELQSVVSELEAFTYTVSHDLKSPLRAVDGYSRILLEDYGERLDKDAREIIGNIRSICRDMIEMINKLLQYSTTSRLGLNKSEIDMEEMVLSIFSELKSTCPGRDLRLNIETGLPKLWADRILLKQAIYNILSNGVKFTKNRQKAVISVGSTITGDEYVFYFKDNGVGFDMEFSGKLFGLFQRLHTNSEFEGSGIGLVTIKKIIQKHGGRTWIEGRVDEGATVYFTLPLSW